MSGMKKRFSIPMVVITSIILIITGCGDVGQSGNNDSTAQSTAAQNTPPVKLQMFFSDAGIIVPPDVDINDNPYVNELEKLANVDLEIEMPAYADYINKVNLSIASGDIPDIIHAFGTVLNEIKRTGPEGQFLELTKYIENSEILSQKYPKSLYPLMEASDGKLYTFRSMDSKSVGSITARIDLLDELNDGKIPASPDEWYQVLKKEKEKYPDSVPVTSRGGLLYLNNFFQAYGCTVNGNGVEWQLTDDKYISSFEAPGMKAAVLFHKKLYDEGILDPTFITNKSADETDRINNKNAMFNITSPVSAINFNTAWATDPEGKRNNYMIAHIPMPVAPVATNIQNVKYYPAPIGTHAMAISSKSKNPDAAVRVVEALFSDRMTTLAAWGLEGTDYNVGTDGKKTINVEEWNKSTYRNIFGVMNTYWYPDAVNATLQAKLTLIKDEEYKKKFLNAFEKGLETREKEIFSNKPLPGNYFTLSPDTLNMQKQAWAESSAIVCKAVIGEISMDEYDKQIVQYLAKYQKVTDEYNRLYEDYKAKYGKY